MSDVFDRLAPGRMTDEDELLRECGRGDSGAFGGGVERGGQTVR
ncbi:hypothetical protein ACFYXQ_30415 [Nocardia jiangxiensis]|uniref:Uncharacterized protein n=1 Tax=Nocardia jiangxiensis TaxID=282685 RepID=A0ABW6S734_9NOCA